MNNNELMNLYTLAELAYKKHFEKNMDNKEYIFPENWYENKNYKFKIELISEAIKNNTLIENIPKYQDMVEGVKKELVKDNKKYTII